jgi:hypothetical protein
MPDDDVTEAAASRDAVATRDERDERNWTAAVEGRRWWSTSQCCRRWLDAAGGSSDGCSGRMASVTTGDDMDKDITLAIDNDSLFYQSFLPKTGYPKKYVD